MDTHEKQRIVWVVKKAIGNNMIAQVSRPHSKAAKGSYAIICRFPDRFSIDDGEPRTTVFAVTISADDIANCDDINALITARAIVSFNDAIKYHLEHLEQAIEWARERYQKL